MYGLYICLILACFDTVVNFKIAKLGGNVVFFETI